MVKLIYNDNKGITAFAHYDGIFATTKFKVQYNENLKLNKN